MSIFSCELCILGAALGGLGLLVVYCLLVMSQRSSEFPDQLIGGSAPSE